MRSANIPFEIEAEIIKRVLPVKSLIRFRSVSKQWKSLIDSSEFINDHSVNQNHQDRLVVSYYPDSGYNYVSIVDDDSFPQHMLSLNVSTILKLASDTVIVGSSHGLVCLWGETANRMSLFVIWNPSIRKSVGIVLHHTAIKALGFGVCPKTGDPKILKTTYTFISMNWNAQVFSLSSRSWRSVPVNLPHKPKNLKFNQVETDGVIHWVADDYDFHHRIISFDLTTEEFGDIELPEKIASSRDVYIYNIKERLVVLSSCTCDVEKHGCDVWLMLKNGASKSSFTKLFTVDFKAYKIIGFRNNGQPIIYTDLVDATGCSPKQQLQVYDPCLGKISDLGIYGLVFNMTSYTESLLLLNHFDSLIECGGLKSSSHIYFF